MANTKRQTDREPMSIEEIEDSLVHLRAKDRRRNIFTLAVVAFAALSFLWSRYETADLTGILNRRTPLIHYIEAASEQQVCLDDLDSEYNVALAEAVAADTANGEERLAPDHPAIVRYLQAGQRLGDREKLCPTPPLPEDAR